MIFPDLEIVFHYNAIPILTSPVAQLVSAWYLYGSVQFADTI